MFERYRQRRAIKSVVFELDQNKREMIKALEKDLREKIEAVYRADFDGNTRADEIERLKPSRDFLHYLKQERIREDLLQASIAVPDEYATPYDDDILLNQKGEEWARIQLRKFRVQQIEFWAKLITPLLSLIVAIVALFFSVSHYNQPPKSPPAPHNAPHIQNL